MSYQEAGVLLADKTDEELIEVLTGPSRKLGDTACDMLARRNRFDLVIRALAEKKARTRDGKVRALNLLLCEGRRLPEALPIYCQYADDRSLDAASCALFGLAFWQNDSVLPLLEQLLGSKNTEQIQRAIDALKHRDPRIYSSAFFDSHGVWSPATHTPQIPRNPDLDFEASSNRSSHDR